MFSLRRLAEPRLTINGVYAGSPRKFIQYDDTSNLLFNYGHTSDSTTYDSAHADFAASVGVTPSISFTWSYMTSLMDLSHMLSVDNVVAISRGLLECTLRLRRGETL